MQGNCRNSSDELANRLQSLGEDAIYQTGRGIFYVEINSWPPICSEQVKMSSTDKIWSYTRQMFLASGKSSRSLYFDMFQTISTVFFIVKWPELTTKTSRTSLWKHHYADIRISTRTDQPFKCPLIELWCLVADMPKTYNWKNRKRNIWANLTPTRYSNKMSIWEICPYQWITHHLVI